MTAREAQLFFDNLMRKFVLARSRTNFDTDTIVALSEHELGFVIDSLKARGLAKSANP